MKQLSRIIGASVATEAVLPALALTLIAIPGWFRAATAPPATLLLTAPGPIRGGVATIGSSGVTYFCTLSAGQSPSTIFALNLNGTV